MNDEHATQIAEVNTEVAAAATVPPPVRKINPKTLARAEKLAREYAEKDKQNALHSIDNYNTWIKRELEKAAKAEEKNKLRSKEWAEAWSLLVSGGFKPREIDWQRWRIQVETTEKKLAKLAKLIGQLDMDNAEKEIADEEKGIVRVIAYSKRYEFVKVVWEHKLTAKDRCKIVTETVTKTSLVCDVDSNK